FGRLSARLKSCPVTTPGLKARFRGSCVRTLLGARGARRSVGKQPQILRLRASLSAQDDKLLFFQSIEKLCSGADGLRVRLVAARVLDHLVALRAQLEEGLSFHVEARHIAIDDRLPDHAERRFGTEVVLVVKAMHHLHYVVDG